MSKTFLFIFLILFSFSFVFGDGEYKELGTVIGDFTVGTTRINGETSLTYTTNQIDQLKGTALVSDLDNDGTKEIIVNAGKSIHIYQDSTLNLIGTYESETENFSNIIVYDIDGNTHDDIIFYELETNNITFLEWNGSDFNRTHILTATDKLELDVVIACDRDAGRCLADLTIEPDGRNHYGFGFDKSTFGNFHNWTINDPDRGYCNPSVKRIAVEDINLDGINEYVASYLLYDDGGSEFVHIKVYQVEPTINDWKIITNITRVMGSICGGSGLHCNANCDSNRLDNPAPIESMVSSPAVLDYDEDHEGFEIVVGYAIDGDEFELGVWKNNGDFIDTHPEILHADGTILSNAIVTDVFRDTDQEDVCVLGYSEKLGMLDLLCGSQNTDIVPQTYEFKAFVPYNITWASFNQVSPWIYSKQYALQLHSIQAVEELQGGNNLYEIVTSWGVYNLITANHDDAVAPCTSIHDCTMVPLWVNPKENSIITPVDYEGSGLLDFIMYDVDTVDPLFPYNDNLWYVNDGISNAHCGEGSVNCIETYTINPCIESVWKNGTQVQVTMTLDDGDEVDTLSGRVIIYADESAFRQDSGWSAGAVAGTTHSFNFVANETITNGKLTLLSRESDDATKVQNANLSFSVGKNGVEFGDCVTEVVQEIGIIDVVEGAIVTEDNEENNSIKNVFDGVEEQTNLSHTTIWLLIMVMLAITMYFVGWQNGNSNMSALSSIVGVVEVGMIILGARLGFLSTGLVVTISVVGLGLIALFVSKMWTSSSGG